MWTVDFAAEAERDFGLIFEHLLHAYEAFGDDPEVALTRAQERLMGLQAAALDLGKAPYQGTLRPDILEDVRFVQRAGAVFWFVLDPEPERVHVLAVFFGGQDHIRHMLTRLLAPRAP